MPFGKFRGVYISEVPRDYLLWLREQDFIKQWLRDEIEAELRRRSEGQVNNPVLDIKIEAERLPLAREVFEAGYRSLSKRFHPDAGGAAEDMLALNTFMGDVRSQFAALDVSR